MTNRISAMQQEPQRRGPAKRKRGKPIQMDYEQTMIPAPNYQNWLQNPADLVSRRGGMEKRHDIMSSTKIANLMEVPPVALNGGLLSRVNKDIYYPAPLLDLWIKSTQPPHNSPSGLYRGFEEFDGRLDNLFNAPREQVLPVDKELPENMPVHEDTPPVLSEKSDVFPRGGDNTYSVGTASDHGPSSHSDLETGRLTKKKRLNSNGGFHTVPENEKMYADFNPRSPDMFPTPDQVLLVETGPTQTQGNPNHPSDKITESIHAQLKSHFDTLKSVSGAPQFESLDVLASGMTRKSAALLFYQTCVLATRDVLRVEQKEPYGEILISRGPKM
ncbi:sister chromatid cohesion 1 protein, putative [Medicago truncatula]|uniref:Sister chromatid cohesion 1 protein, putative n=1 Tax=Medicago truncatula TaxID=3880 RepID=G7K219_MEDTR|nr:sister chromatid cohesion 1 protein, putative [Medicago truncatula]